MRYFDGRVTIPEIAEPVTLWDGRDDRYRGTDPKQPLEYDLLVVTADAGNTGNVAIGSQFVTAVVADRTGLVMAPGDKWLFASGCLCELYVATATDNNAIHFFQMVGSAPAGFTAAMVQKAITL